jgi:hypothetical protein
MPTKPTDSPTWADGVGAVLSNPGATKQAAGWASPEKPSDGNMNWILNVHGRWINYLAVAATDSATLTSYLGW